MWCVNASAAAIVAGLYTHSSGDKTTRRRMRPKKTCAINGRKKQIHVSNAFVTLQLIAREALRLRVYGAALRNAKCFGNSNAVILWAPACLCRVLLLCIITSILSARFSVALRKKMQQNLTLISYAYGERCTNTRTSTFTRHSILVYTMCTCVVHSCCIRGA